MLQILQQQHQQQQLTLRHTKRLVFVSNGCLADYLEVNKKVTSETSLMDEKQRKTLVIRQSVPLRLAVNVPP